MPRFQKGHKKVGGRKKGSLNKKTVFFSKLWEGLDKRQAQKEIISIVMSKDKNKRWEKVELLKALIKQSPKDVDVTSGGEQVTTLLDLINLEDEK